MSQEKKISIIDQHIYKKIRVQVKEFQVKSLAKMSLQGAIILDIAPQIHEGISKLSDGRFLVETLDIDPQYKPTYLGDLCAKTDIPDNKFDAVFCTEVLEHVSNPFNAILEIERVLKPGGWIFATSPFGFRIHGPLPDNWRISEHGWRELLKSFEDVEIHSLDDPDRFLMPFHYSIRGKKKLNF